MEKIEDEIFNKSLSFSVKDPYATAINIMEAARRMGKIKEKENKFLTSGPRQRCEISFVLLDMIDKNARIKFNVEMKGESNGIRVLEIIIRGKFQAKIPSSEGFVFQTFAEFYEEKILPKIEGLARSRAERIEKEMLNSIGYLTVE